VHTQLQRWYRQYGRHDLPWRNTQDIYKIYLSEIMLQQTQVRRAQDEYYPRFLHKYPTLQHLADAPLEDVLSIWSGLGYYRRAKNLHLSAQHARDGLPQTQEELTKLPGIGAYTARAICSFGYEQCVAVVDTNIARVIKRFFALINPTNTQVWRYAEDFLDTHNTRAHNLALMDVGSMVCLPTNPQCGICPLRVGCKGKDSPQIYTQKQKTNSIAMELFFGVYIHNGAVAMHYSKDGMYNNMLVLPNTDPIEEHFLGSFKHSYTKCKLTVHLYTLEELPQEERVWVALDKFETAPVSSMMKKAWKLLQKKGLHNAICTSG